jgi:Ca2+-transporting ATPase
LTEGNFYSQTKRELFDCLSTRDSGLTDKEAASRLERSGPNKLSEKKRVSPLEIYLSQFKSILILILIAAAIFTYAVYFFGGKERTDLIEASLILAIILMITILGFVQEYRAERSIEALKKLLAFKATVVRDGKEHEIDTADLVPGDLVILEEGLKVPADIRLIEVSSLHTNEASLTGESIPIEKVDTPIAGSLQIADQKNMVFSGTIITSGRGKGVVVETGDRTQVGKIASLVAGTEREVTPLQKRLDDLGKILGYGTIAISLFVFVFIVFISADFSQLPLFERVLQSFIVSVALAVAAIPEGLPAVVTISLAFGTQRMLKRNALVRKLSSIETLGSIDTICADKTGTLTAGEMSVREIFFDGKDYKVTGENHEFSGEFILENKKVDNDSLNLIMQAGLSCNNATLDENGKLLGDPTEVALLVSAHKALVKSPGERLFEIPFSSERKMMSVVTKSGSNKFVYSKGAAEVVLSKCSHILRNGASVPLNEVEKTTVLNKNNEMASHALRVLGFAYKDADSWDEAYLEKGLTFLGLQGMMDPPRKEVKELINSCNRSGIRVIMITGDYMQTAKAIAGELGIKGDVLTGEDLEQLKENEFEKRIDEINIYARVNPEHKLKIVAALKKKGHLVAMTGDGVNDAPALKRADIGIAMGKTGTDVAKEASDMVLLDDQFKTIVAAIEEGRGIFDNIRKFVNFLLSDNIGEVLVVFLALLLFKNLPLTAVMLLWINVITDGLPAVALGLDPAEKGILRFSPKKFQGEIINKRTWIEILIFSALLTAATLGIFFLNLPDLTKARTAAFVAIIIFELVRLVAIRAKYQLSWFSNFWLPAAIIGSIILQVVIVYVPTFAAWFGISPISLFDWIYIVLVSFGLLVGLRLIDNVLNRLPSLSEIQTEN